MKINLHNLTTSLRTLLGQTKEHIEDTNIHVTPEDKTKINNAIITSDELLNGSHINFNTLEPNRVYRVGDPTGAVGAPPEPWGVLVSYQTIESFIVQEYYAGVKNMKYMRRGYDGGLDWSEWVGTGFEQGTLDKWNLGFSAYERFQPACVHITDWNTLTKNGMYMGAQPTLNAPDATDWYMGFNIVHNDTYITQKVIGVTIGKEFQRRKNNGGWGAWVETSPTANITPTLNTGWYINSSSDLIYSKYKNVVHVRGMVYTSVANPQTFLFTLPVGFRPTYHLGTLTLYSPHWVDKYRNAFIGNGGDVMLQDASGLPVGGNMYISGSFYIG